MAKKEQIAMSVHQRLLNQARSTKRPFMELLQYYAMEKFLLRMSKSEYVDSFILKGALLLKTTELTVVRPTRDIDFLGLIAGTVSEFEEIISQACTVHTEEDRLLFDSDSVSGKEIREN